MHANCTYDDRVISRLQTIVTDVRGVCLSVCHAAEQPLPNAFGLLFKSLNEIDFVPEKCSVSDL